MAIDQTQKLYSMRHKLLFAITISICCSFISKPFVYYFGMIDPITGKEAGKPEKATAVYQKPKGKATSNDYIISGAKSSVRLKIIQTNFYANADESTASLNPSLYISLYKVSSGKTSRTLSMTADEGGAMWIPINISKPDAYSIRITPGIAMQPGEYVFVDKTTTTAEGNFTVWGFGID